MLAEELHQLCQRRAGGLSAVDDLRRVRVVIAEEDPIDLGSVQPPEQALLGDFAGALDDAVMSSGEAHQNIMMQVMNNKARFDTFGRLVLEVILQNLATKRRRASSLPPPNKA